MKVLFITPFYEPAWVYGGVARASAIWAQALAVNGVDVTVWTTTANGIDELDIPNGQSLLRNGVHVTYFPRFRCSGNRFVSLAMLQACVLHMKDYDIVHLVGLWTFPVWSAALVAEALSKPYVVSTHGMLMPWAIKHHALIKYVFFHLFEKPRLAHAEAVICTSELEKRYFLEYGIKKRVEIISNVVDIGQIQPIPEHFRCRYGLQSAFVILFAGRLVENKGVHLTLAAFAQIADAYPDARLVIVGPSEDDSSIGLVHQVQKIGLTEHVLFTGLLTDQDYWDALAGSDLFVLNSYSENFGLTPAEAQALGVPVLISDQVGIGGLVLKYCSGWVTPLQVEIIAETMSLILANRENLGEIGQNGIRLAHDHFSLFQVGKQWKLLLDEIAIRRSDSAQN